MNKIPALCFFVFLIGAAAGFAQTKSLAEAEAEIKNFRNPAGFSVSYDDPKDLTSAKILLDLRAGINAFQKPFKKFEWEMDSIYAGNRIDEKPVRNRLCVYTQSKRPLFASGSALALTLDGEKIEFGEALRSSEVKGGKVRENLCWEIGMEIIRDLARAERLGFEIGAVKSDFPSELFESLRDYARLLRIEKQDAAR